MPLVFLTSFYRTCGTLGIEDFVLSRYSQFLESESFAKYFEKKKKKVFCLNIRISPFLILGLFCLN